jgi:hypothetical protein
MFSFPLQLRNIGTGQVNSNGWENFFICWAYIINNPAFAGICQSYSDYFAISPDGTVQNRKASAQVAPLEKRAATAPSSVITVTDISVFLTFSAVSTSTTSPASTTAPTGSPSVSSTPTPTATPNKDISIGTEAAIGIIIPLVFIIFAVSILWYLRRRRNRNNEMTEMDDMNGDHRDLVPEKMDDKKHFAELPQNQLPFQADGNPIHELNSQNFNNGGVFELSSDSRYDSPAANLEPLLRRGHARAKSPSKKAQEVALDRARADDNTSI